LSKANDQERSMKLHGSDALSPRGGAGWRYLLVSIDDASRLGFAQLYPARGPTRRSLLRRL
jgi:hypothetical protein